MDKSQIFVAAAQNFKVVSQINSANWSWTPLLPAMTTLC